MRAFLSSIGRSVKVSKQHFSKNWSLLSLIPIANAIAIAWDHAIGAPFEQHVKTTEAATNIEK